VYIEYTFTIVFCCCFVYIFLPDVDSMHFVTLYHMWNVFTQKLTYAYNRADWVVDPFAWIIYGVLTTLCHCLWSMCSNMLEHNNLLNLKLGCFYILTSIQLIYAFYFVLFPMLVNCVIAWFENKIAWIKPLPYRSVVFNLSNPGEPYSYRYCLGDPHLWLCH